MGIDTVDRNNVFPYGQSQVDFGLVVADATNGFGLVTRGFLWQGDAIWLNIESVAPITTVWGSYSFGTSATTWTAYSFGTSSTTWTPSKLQQFGEFPPKLL